MTKRLAPSGDGKSASRSGGPNAGRAMTDTTKPNGDRYRPSDWEAALRAMRAERGWLGEPPQVPAAGAPSPSHRYKWHKMMGATNLLPDEEREAIRQAKQRAEKEQER